MHEGWLSAIPAGTSGAPRHTRLVCQRYACPCGSFEERVQQTKRDLEDAGERAAAEKERAEAGSAYSSMLRPQRRLLGLAGNSARPVALP